MTNSRLESWTKGKDIEFKDEEAREKYKERAERFKRAVRIEEQDRVPVQPSTSLFQARYAGYTTEEVLHDPEKMGKAFKKFQYDLEPEYNTASFGPIPYGSTLDLLDYKAYDWPGHGLPSDANYQWREGAYMEGDEYDELIEDPGSFIFRKVFPRVAGKLEGLKELPLLSQPTILPVLTSFASEKAQEALKTLMKAGEKQMEWIRTLVPVSSEITKSGYPGTRTGGTFAPYDLIADRLRGTKGISIDLRRKPEVLKEGMEAMLPLMVKRGMAGTKRSNNPCVFMPLHKGDDEFMSKEGFREFYWPTLKECIEKFVEEGLAVDLFAEGSYDERLEILAEDHPDGDIVWHFDQTDMEKADEILGDQVCLAGNVPVSLLQSGTPEKVKEYCEDLVEKAGPEGLIIRPGGSVMNAKTENVKALINFNRE